MPSADAQSYAHSLPVRADEALLRPVRQGNAFEETVERVLRVIKLGVVPEGERLPSERDLSVRLGVSRVTLREAIRALQEAGYVESRRGRYGGTFVRHTSASTRRSEPGPVDETLLGDLDDTLLFRDVVECGAAERAAAPGLAPAQLEHLEAMLAQTANASDHEYRRCDSRLHLAIAEVTGSRSLTAAVADARTRVNGLLDAIPLLTHNIRHSDRQHRRIVEAIRVARPDLARAAMDEHLRGTGSLLRGFLQ